VKVALVCPYDLGRFGGVQDQVIKIAAWLGDAGHDPVIVGPGSSGPDGAVLVGPAKVLRANGSDVPLALSPEVMGRVAAAVSDADVVHVHEPLMPMVSIAAMLRAVSPIVATFHAAPSVLAQRAYRIGKRNVAKVMRRAGVVTAVSPVAARAVGDVAGVRIIPNGLDINLFPGVEPNPDRVVFIGRDEPRKGLAVLLDAWGEVHAGRSDAELVVIGSDTRSGVPPGVRFLGRVDEEQKRLVLAGAGIACMPNLGGESFGIVVVEAMAARCAVVASAIPGFVHVAGDAALLVKPGESAGVAWALRRLLGDAALAERLRAVARVRAEQFDRTAVLDQYLAAYVDAVAGR
jgi:phosphatidylinositol alpha-mannosyltransferase